MAAVTITNGQQELNLGINDRFTDEELVTDVFLKGFCSNVSNIKATGISTNLGNFFNAQDIIGIDKGVIISTGLIESATGPNVFENTTGPFTRITGDQDLDEIATAPVFNVAGLEFDFVPISDKVSFTYVFASEEYCIYVDSLFNDVFGFFVSGPGIEGNFSNNGINVARIPGTNEPVSINSVNHRTNNAYYVKNELKSEAEYCGIEFAPKQPNTIEFDGFTVPITAEFDVIPCETYTIRLMIGDVEDEFLNSAVFLEMNSFDIGGNIKVSASSETGMDSLVSEGCTDGMFTFERVGTDLSNQETINLVVSENSTASLGDDIENIDLSITFPEGESIVNLPINVLTDNITEDLESFGLELDVCPCTNGGKASLLISDESSLEANLDGYYACAGEEFVLKPNIIGGAPPFTLEWDDGNTADSIKMTLTESINVGVKVTDFCDRDAITNAIIDIGTNPLASIGGDYTFCAGVNIGVKVELEGSPPWDLSYQVNDDPFIEVKNIMTNPYLLPISKVGEVKLITFNDRTCSGNVIGAANLTLEEVEIETFVTPATCSSTLDGEISFDILSSSPAREITWSSDKLSGFGGRELLPGNYQLKLIDERGCSFEEILALPIDPNSKDCKDLQIYIPNVFSPNSDGSEDDFLIQLQHDPSIESVKSFSLFDRWGNRVFEKLNFEKTINDIGLNKDSFDYEILPNVLGYIMTLNMVGGQTRSISGTITVIR